MSMLEATATVPLVSALGWALVHFVWQGTLIAAVLAAVLCGLRRRSADARYVTCCAAMALMALAPVVTFAALLSSFMVARPELLGMRLDLTPVGAALLAAGLSLWLVGPIVTFALTVRRRLPGHRPALAFRGRTGLVLGVTTADGLRRNRGSQSGVVGRGGTRPSRPGSGGSPGGGPEVAEIAGHAGTDCCVAG